MYDTEKGHNRIQCSCHYGGLGLLKREGPGQYGSRTFFEKSPKRNVKLWMQEAASDVLAESDW